MLMAESVRVGVDGARRPQDHVVTWPVHVRRRNRWIHRRWRASGCVSDGRPRRALHRVCHLSVNILAASGGSAWGLHFWGPVEGHNFGWGGHGPIYTTCSAVAVRRRALLHSFALRYEWTLLPDLALYQKFAASGKIHWGFGGPQEGQNFSSGPSVRTAPAGGRIGLRTRDSVVVSSIPGRRNLGRLVLGWVTVFWRAYHLGM